MDLSCYACGFNGLHQLDNSDDGVKQTWVKIVDDLKSEPCLSISWDALYIQNMKGGIQRNGNSFHPPAEYENQTPTMLCAAEDRLLALYPDGSVWLRTDVWRRLTLQSAGRASPGPVRHISVGRHTLAACDEDGALLTLDAVPTPAGERLQSVACGREHVALLTRSGRVYTYGGGSRGQLGTGDLSSADQPQLVAALDGLRVTQVCAGGWHTAALSSAGDVYAWGWNESDQLGLGQEVNVAPEPALVEALPTDSRVTQLACGSRHTLALLEGGTVFGWGWNGYGQLAGPACDRTSPHPLPLPPGQQAVRVAAGGWCSALLTSG